MSKHLAPLIDADIITYRCGFAVKDNEPVEYALQTVKTALEGILSQFPDAPYHKLYLTGAGNYREKVATTKPYKGNRDPNNKPHYYTEIRDYLREYHDAVLVELMEADDVLGMEQCKNTDKSTVICSIDKDLLCIPGWHYNFVRKELQYVPLAEANKNYWRQVIMGDPTDNIQGLPKYGIKAATKIIDGTDGTWLGMHTRVREEYDKVHGDEAADKFKEMATLVWILRQPYLNFDGTAIFEEEEDAQAEV